MGDWNAGVRASVNTGGRGAVAEIEGVLAVDVDSLRGLVRVLVDSALHLLQDLVDLNQVVLGAGVGHGRQVVLLGHGSGAGRRSAGLLVVNVLLRRGCHVVGAGHGTGVQAESAVKGEKGSADLLIGGRVDLATLGVGEEVVNHVEGALAAVVIAAVVANVLSSGRVQGLLVEVQSIVCRWLGCIVASMPSLVCEGGGVSPNVAIMIIVARRSWRQISL